MRAAPTPTPTTNPTSKSQVAELFSLKPVLQAKQVYTNSLPTTLDVHLLHPSKLQSP